MAKRKATLKITKIEKTLIFFVFLLAIITPISIVYSKATLSKSNIELEKIKKEIVKQNDVNESLEMKINELASLTNIQTIAKEYGLSYNNNNVMVIDEKDKSSD